MQRWNATRDSVSMALSAFGQESCPYINVYIGLDPTCLVGSHMYQRTTDSISSHYHVKGEFYGGMLHTSRYEVSILQDAPHTVYSQSSIGTVGFVCIACLSFVHIFSSSYPRLPQASSQFCRRQYSHFSKRKSFCSRLGMQLVIYHCHSNVQ